MTSLLALVTKRNLASQNGLELQSVVPMPVIRFVREDRDVECYPGENLREVALRAEVELYGLKGRLGNCGGCGQCITCFVDVVGESAPGALSDRTAVEDQKLRRRPQSWRLACQALVQHSLLVLTRPQVGLEDADNVIAAARARDLPAGPMAWPEPPQSLDEEAGPAEATASDGTATSGEADANEAPGQ